MEWEIKIKFDDDQIDVGSISLTWSDPTYGNFTHSGRIKANQEGATVFITAAIAARDVWQDKQLENSNKAAWVLDQINALDPKAGA